MTSGLASSLFLLLCLATLATPQDSPQSTDRIPVDAMQNQLIRTVSPLYPPLARQARIQGTVVLKIVIDKSGGVQNVQKVSGHPMLAPAAAEAVTQWRYKPYLLNGDPIEVETNVAVKFALSDKPAAGGMAGDAPGGLHGSIRGTETTGPPSATEPKTPKRVRVSQSVMQVFLIRRVDPVPPAEPGVRIQGSVVLKAVIDRSGNVEQLQLLSGHPLLVLPALETARRWKYQPFLSNGGPVEVETTVRVDFAETKSK